MLFKCLVCVDGLCWIYRVWSSTECASKFLPYVFCMSGVMSSFKSLRAESQVFSLLMLFLCVPLNTMWSGKSLQLLCIVLFGMFCLSAISMIFVKIMLAVCMLVGMVV